MTLFGHVTFKHYNLIYRDNILLMYQYFIFNIICWFNNSANKGKH